MHCNDIAPDGPRIALLASDGHVSLSTALENARCVVRHVAPADWTRLLCADAGVPVIPDDYRRAPDWPLMRVQLNETARFFVVGVPGHDAGRIVAAMRDGAFDVLTAHDQPERVAEICRRVATAESAWRCLFPTERPPHNDRLVGRSPAIRRLHQLITRVAANDASVLILGESGVGKECVAEALHARSGRNRFVAVNCTALPANLLESELFGAARGAYTGAHVERPGLVEQADGGTLFLDEIGDMDLALQPKLLRFLETRRARRVGGRADYAVNVRVVAATNAALRERVRRGLFREDLYYRLAGITLEVPPLRERPEDIPLLCQRFADLAGERASQPRFRFEPALLAALQKWSWPGNVRELRHAIERMALLATGPVLGLSDWHPPAALNPPDRHAPAFGAGAAPSASLSRRQKRDLAFRLLDESGEDHAWVAAQLSIHPTTLYRWRKAAGRA